MRAERSDHAQRERAKGEFAAQHLFGKPVSELTRREMAELLDELRTKNRLNWGRHNEWGFQDLESETVLAGQFGIEPRTIYGWSIADKLTVCGYSPDGERMYNAHEAAKVAREGDGAAHRTDSWQALRAAKSLGDVAGEKLPPRELPDMDSLVCTDVAARIAYCTESAIRQWVRRGHLAPARDEQDEVIRCKKGHNRFRVGDIIEAGKKLGHAG